MAAPSPRADVFVGRELTVAQIRRGLRERRGVTALTGDVGVGQDATDPRMFLPDAQLADLSSTGDAGAGVRAVVVQVSSSCECGA